MISSHGQSATRRAGSMLASDAMAVREGKEDAKFSVHIHTTIEREDGESSIALDLCESAER